jgi:hypothetical protein
MRALLLIALLAACGDDHKATPKDGGMDAVVVDAPTDGATGLRACLDHPSNEARPPSTGLPCDLLPPGFAQ